MVLHVCSEIARLKSQIFTIMASFYFTVIIMLTMIKRIPVSAPVYTQWCTYTTNVHTTNHWTFPFTKGLEALETFYTGSCIKYESCLHCSPPILTFVFSFLRYQYDSSVAYIYKVTISKHPSTRLFIVQPSNVQYGSHIYNCLERQ